MKRIYDVADKIGSPSALTQDQGEIIFNLISDAIDREEDVELDFENVESMISAFLNVAIGRLYGKYDSTIINKHLILTNFPSSKKSTLQLVITNAKRYYTDNEVFEKIAKEVIG